MEHLVDRTAANINQMLDLNAYRLTGAAKKVLITTYDPLISWTSNALNLTQAVQTGGVLYDLVNRSLTSPYSSNSLNYLPNGHK